MDLDLKQYTIQLLFQVPKLADECCLLLNHEWKRSHEARMRSLNIKNDRYPLNVILIGEKQDGKLMVAGHCRVSAIRAPDGHGPAVFLESVVISPDLRRKGLGRRLLFEVENYLKTSPLSPNPRDCPILQRRSMLKDCVPIPNCVGFAPELPTMNWELIPKRGVRSLYLYTMGQEAFYGKIGYTPCQPVDVFCSVPDLDFPELPPPGPPARRRSYIGQNGTAPRPPPPPPPPPPLPAPRIPASDRSFYKGSKTFMHKIIFPHGEYRP